MGANQHTVNTLHRYPTPKKLPVQTTAATTATTIKIQRKQTGTMFVNTGSTAIVTYQLPPGAEKGQMFRFLLTDATAAIRVDPGNKALALTISSTYAKQTADLYATASAVGDYLMLVYDGVDTWHALSERGTWSMEG